MNSRVSTEPISTTNITGLLHCTLGRSIRNASLMAGHTSSGANNACARDRRRGTGISGVMRISGGSEYCFKASIIEFLINKS